MKYRTDFVTNSSSSSFLLAFDSEESVRDSIFQGLADEDKDFFAQIWKDVKKAKRMTEDEALEWIAQYQEYTTPWNLLHEHPEAFESGGFAKIMATDAFREECARVNAGEITEAKEKMRGKDVLTVVEYCDHTDDGWMLERNIMPRFPHTVYVFDNH